MSESTTADGDRVTRPTVIQLIRTGLTPRVLESIAAQKRPHTSAYRFSRDMKAEPKDLEWLAQR